MGLRDQPAISMSIDRKQMNRIPDEVQMLIWNYIFPKHCWKHPVIEKFNRVLVSLPQLEAACLPSLSLGRDRVTFFYIAPKPRRIRKGWYSPRCVRRIVKVTRLLTDEEKGRCLSSLSLSGLRDTDRFGNVYTPPNWRARRFSKEHRSWI